MHRSIRKARTVHAVSVATVCLAALGLSQCRGPQQASPPADAPPASSTAPKPTPAALAPAPTLDRAALLSAIDAAAAGFAAGSPAAGADPLTGRAFDMRLAFACNGVKPSLAATTGPSAVSPGGDEGLATARWGAEGRTLQLSLTPADWSQSSLLASGASGAAWEAVDGLWIARPWLRAPGCPAVTGDPLQQAAAPASPQSAGLAVVFDTDGSRVGRRNGRAYDFVVRGQGEAPATAPQAGYRLRLAGRIVGFPNGRAIRCSAAGGDQRPVCVAAVRLDTVAFETAEGEVLSTWQAG